MVCEYTFCTPSERLVNVSANRVHTRVGGRIRREAVCRFWSFSWVIGNRGGGRVGGDPRFTGVNCLLSTCTMSRCKGSETVGTKVSAGMLAFLDRRADDLGICRAELLRRVLDVYAESTDGDLSCPHCSERLRMTV